MTQLTLPTCPLPGCHNSLHTLRETCCPVTRDGMKLYRPERDSGNGVMIAETLVFSESAEPEGGEE